jgi:transposase InsO family protein
VVQHRWILTATYYFTKFIESIPTRSVSHKVIISFLEDIMSRFGCPRRIIIDNATSFKVEPLIKFCEKYGITIVHSTPYYPKGNGLAESSNVFKEMVLGDPVNWNFLEKYLV